jgi:MFS family permease
MRERPGSLALTLSAVVGAGICSYSTSALLGTYAASMGDRYGHRACIAVYGVIYAVSCATMHTGNFWVLMFGRVCGGVAYSLLYSSCVPPLLLSTSYRVPSPFSNQSPRVLIAQDSASTTTGPKDCLPPFVAVCSFACPRSGVFPVGCKWLNGLPNKQNCYHVDAHFKRRKTLVSVPLLGVSCVSRCLYVIFS